MPRCVRNFWIETDVDGKKERVATGPRQANGGFETTIKMRNDGDVAEAGTIKGVVDDDGTLRLIWIPNSPMGLRYIDTIELARTSR
jgi:hypothetical protein